MKKKVVIFFTIFFLSGFVISCNQEENFSPKLGIATFSLSPQARGNGRVSETTAPAFVLFSVRDSKGNVQEKIKLPLYSLGQGYLSENLDLQTGIYQLTQFAVLDVDNKVIYATPLEGSDLAKYVTHPLPIDFTIEENQNTQVVPQVLAVSTEDTPESFGLASFAFDVVERDVNVNIRLQNHDLDAYDSAYIVFKYPTVEIKQKLTLDNASHITTGRVANIPLGDCKISVSYFSTLTRDYESLERTDVVDIHIASTATDLISDETGVFIKDANDPTKKFFSREDYYYYQLYMNTKLEGFVRLPVDPTNPFVQISMFQSKWLYAYADRTFYNSSLNGSSNFLIGSGAFEVYGQSGDTHDRLVRNIIDTTSLEPVISRVRDKVWNNVDCVVIIYGPGENDEIFLFHRWDLRRSSPGGRIKSSSSPVNWSKAEMDNRRRTILYQ